MLNVLQGTEEINSKGGNILIGRLISNIGLERMNLRTLDRIKHGEISPGNLLKMAVMLPANGRIDFTDIEQYRNDLLFKEIPGIKKVAAAAFRRRLNDFGTCK